MTPFAEKIKRLQGPVLVLGASGFIGSVLFRTILGQRPDVFGTVFHTPAWRLEDLPSPNVLQADLLVDANIDYLLDTLKPKTVFNCIAYGAYSFQTSSEWIYPTNFNLTEKLVHRLADRAIA